MSKRAHILRDHIDLDGERYVLLDATPEQVLRWLHKHHRTQAFAAIRRAASEARVYDRYSKDLASREIHDTARMYESWAGVIRQAIRTAIGSRKV